MIPGPQVAIGATTYTMPPLPFKGLKKHKAFLSRAMRGEVDAEKALDDFELMFDCVYLALKRNYPALTEEQLLEELDMRNIGQAFAAMMEAVGFQEKRPGE